MNSPGMALASLLFSLRDNMDDLSKVMILVSLGVSAVTVLILYIWTEVLF